jgi:hypothetical protein
VPDGLIDATAAEVEQAQRRLRSRELERQAELLVQGDQPRNMIPALFLPPLGGLDPGQDAQAPAFIVPASQLGRQPAALVQAGRRIRPAAGGAVDPGQRDQRELQRARRALPPRSLDELGQHLAAVLELLAERQHQAEVAADLFVQGGLAGGTGSAAHERQRPLRIAQEHA